MLKSSDSVVTNEMGEYQLVVPDSCRTLIFEFEEIKHTEIINNRNVINVTLTTLHESKPMLSLNPRLDYPWGLQLTLGGHSIFAIALNHYLSQNQSLEIGVCGRGLEVGTKHYFSLNDYGKNKALYVGVITNLSLERDFLLYIPFGFHILSHNGMAFGIELAGKTPLYSDEELSPLNYLGFGINFGFQF